MKMLMKTEWRSPLKRMLPGLSYLNQALVELDRSRGRYCMAKPSFDPMALMARP